MKKTLKEFGRIVSGHPTVRKSTNAFFVTLVGGLGLALSDGNLEVQEVAVAVGATLVATAAVWKGDNKEA